MAHFEALEIKDADLEYEAAIALDNPTTEGFYPDWEPEDYRCLHGHLDSGDCVECLQGADF